ncbi:MAG: chemotaxis protein CheA [Pseudomonadales bacterium]|nr:chemotaxis protein CheA [Pseudomonadales bacterium]
MSIDMEQFHQVFFEESLEGLDVMESSLMELQEGKVDAEVVNSIFRAAHSIKGGSATFGFAAVAEFTHVLETLLDEVRQETRQITAEIIDLLLQSVDCLRDQMSALEQGESADSAQSHELKQSFQKILDADDSDAGSVKPDQGVDSNSESSPGWSIFFKPEIEIVQSGNEPLRMFRELALLGKLETTVHMDALPSFAALEPENCYLYWDLKLFGIDISEAQIKEVFEWVEDEAEIRIESLDAESTAADEAIDSAEGMGASQLSEVAQEEGNNASVTEISKTNSFAKRESASIRVGIDKVDELINTVGELVITQSMLSAVGEDFQMDQLARLQHGLNQLAQNTRELQESVMRIRMLPISFSFNRYPRMIRDLGKQLDKKVELVMVGEQTELDKTVLEKIGDPLTHLVRNSMDHGIESPEERIAAGKSETGIITLKASHQGGNIVIEIIDDGKGLDREKILEKAIEKGLQQRGDHLTDEQIYQLILKAGFSTAEQVSDVSGRGVGMDVVRRNIQELGGSINIDSQQGQGSTITIRLPLTLAILDGQLARVSDQIFVFPLVSIIESLELQGIEVRKAAGGCDLIKLREEYIPVVYLSEVFGISSQPTSLENSLLVVVESNNEKIGVVIDDLLSQQQIVIKSLEENYQKVEGISGATILGDGRVALIADIGELIKLSGATHLNKMEAGSTTFPADPQAA